MLNLKKNLFIAGALALCTLAACSSDNPSSAGSTTMPNATAENSSSSEEVTSSSSINSSEPKQDIFFATAATSVKKIVQGEVAIYGQEYGAEATCSAGKYASKKSYLARIHITEDNTMEKTLSLGNFGSSCDSLLNVFKESCISGSVDVVADANCSRNGNLKVFCYASNPTNDFDAIVGGFTEQSDAVCSTIADGVDSTEYDIPKSEPDSSIKANSGRVFILEPNTTNLEVSDEERVTLDSLAAAFPQKIEYDEIDGMPLIFNMDAEYKFTTEGKKFILNEDGNTCTGNIYAEELGVIRSVSKYGNWRVTNTTTLLVPDIGIVYLVNDGTGSAKEIFQAECEATNGSFYEYNEGAFGCAVKNFTGTPFETIVSEQETMSRNNFNILPEFTPRN